MHVLTILLALAAPPNWSLTCGGDVMLNGVKVGSKPLGSISKMLKRADIAFLNLEIPLTTAKAATTRKTKADIKKRNQFVLKADPKHVAHLAACGVDAVSLASNHAMDYRAPGLGEMIKALDGAGIGHTGAGMNAVLAAAPTVKRAPDGTRVAFVNYLTFIGASALGYCTPAGPESAGVATLLNFGVQNDAAKREISGIVAKARRSADVVVVALHGGIEKATLPTSYQVFLARAFIDAGADVVLGHHPHVLQGAELYRGRPILYSLGNLVSPRPGSSALFHMRFQKRKLLRFVVTPYRIAGGKTVSLKAQEARPRLKAFNALSGRLIARFPNKESRALTAPYPRTKAARKTAAPVPPPPVRGRRSAL